MADEVHFSSEVGGVAPQEITNEGAWRPIRGPDGSVIGRARVWKDDKGLHMDGEFTSPPFIKEVFDASTFYTVEGEIDGTQ